MKQVNLDCFPFVAETDQSFFERGPQRRFDFRTTPGHGKRRTGHQSKFQIASGLHHLRSQSMIV